MFVNGKNFFSIKDGRHRGYITTSRRSDNWQRLRPAPPELNKIKVQRSRIQTSYPAHQPPSHPPTHTSALGHLRNQAFGRSLSRLSQPHAQRISELGSCLSLCKTSCRLHPVGWVASSAPTYRFLLPHGRLGPPSADRRRFTDRRAGELCLNKRCRAARSGWPATRIKAIPRNPSGPRSDPGMSLSWCYCTIAQIRVFAGGGNAFVPFVPGCALEI